MVFICIDNKIEIDLNLLNNVFNCDQLFKSGLSVNPRLKFNLDQLNMSSICLDTEKPKVLTCPEDRTITSKTEKIRVSWENPTFQDNYDAYPRISSTRSTGYFFYYGKNKVVYKATDSSGNEATCQFHVNVKGMNVVLMTEVNID